MHLCEPATVARKEDGIMLTGEGLEGPILTLEIQILIIFKFRIEKLSSFGEEKGVLGRKTIFTKKSNHKTGSKMEFWKDTIFKGQGKEALPLQENESV